MSCGSMNYFPFTFDEPLSIISNENNPEVIEPQLKKCSLCENFNGKVCKHRFDLSYRYADNPEWEEIDRKSYEKRLTDASDC